MAPPPTRITHQVVTDLPGGRPGSRTAAREQSALLRGKRAACPGFAHQPKLAPGVHVRSDSIAALADPVLDGLMIKAASTRLREEGARLLAARLVAGQAMEGWRPAA